MALTLRNHELVADYAFSQIKYETKPVLDNAGKEVPGLHQVWISLNNPKQLNSYTTDTVKAVILAFRRASCDRRAGAVVFTGGGQEIGMACAFTVSGDHARYGQAGPKHGSAPDGGSTDFLDLYVGVGR